MVSATARQWLTYEEHYERLRLFLESGPFYRAMNQLNELKAYQARQSVWQMTLHGSTLRIVATPGSDIVAVFYRNDSFFTGIKALRSALD